MRARSYEDETDGRPPRFTDLLHIRAFAVLYGAETLSIVGDQLARIALAVLVFERTGNTAATALTYATTFLPAIFGGFLLAGIGDRVSRRAVMIGCDIVRAVLFLLMCVAGLPIWALLVLLIAAVFVGPAFSASEVSYLAAKLSPEQFRAATGVRMMTSQAAQVGGFAIGGIVVSVLGPRGALLADAATFAISALVVAIALRRGGTRSATHPPTSAPALRPDRLEDEFAGLWRNERLRALLALTALAGFFIVPEGLAVPFGRDVSASTVVTGLLLASIPLGGLLGAGVLVRAVPAARRETVATWMAIGCGLPLTVTALRPPWPVAVACWLVSGFLAAYQVETTAAVVQSIPDRLRARLLGVASACLLGAQGLGLIIFGLVARWVGAGGSIALAGVLGSGLACLFAARQWQLRRERPGAHRADRRGAGSVDAISTK